MDLKAIFGLEELVVSAALAVREKDSAPKFVGSATYLAPGLFVTARHVAQEAITKYQLDEIEANRRMGQLDTPGELLKGLEATQMTTTGTIGQTWPIKSITFWHEVDFAILSTDESSGLMTRDEAFSIPTVPIELHPLGPGTRVKNYGFFGDPETVNQLSEDGVGHHLLNWAGIPGKVVQYHHERASGAHPPVIEVDNRIKHMMSGGPVFDFSGQVIGINTSNLPEDGNTIVTPFMRTINKPFLYFPPNGMPQRLTIAELGRQGMLEINGHEHLELENDDLKWTAGALCNDCRQRLARV